MTVDGGVGRERWAALVLLTVSAAAAAYIHYRAVVVDAEMDVRRDRLDHLRALTVARPLLEERGRDSLRGTTGLFAGQELVWQRTTAGTVLSLRASAATEDRR